MNVWAPKVTPGVNVKAPVVDVCTTSVRAPLVTTSQPPGQASLTVTLKVTAPAPAKAVTVSSFATTSTNSLIVKLMVPNTNMFLSDGEAVSVILRTTVSAEAVVPSFARYVNAPVLPLRENTPCWADVLTSKRQPGQFTMKVIGVT